MSLSIKNLSKSFDKKLVFKDFTYDFHENGIYVLTGENGVGKTTLLRIIAGLDKDYLGETSGAKSISMAFQEYRLFPTLTALDNVVCAISNRKDEAVLNKAKNILSRLGLSEEDFSLLPCELSGGMKQRVSLARAFLKDATILLLDEPTKELDAENAQIVREIIIEESNNKLVILASHNAQDLEMPLKAIINL